MGLEKHISDAESKILKKLGEDYSREECIHIWNELRGGVRNRVPYHFWQKHKHREYVFFAFLEEFRINNPNKLYPEAPNYRKNKLGRLLNIFDNSPFEVLKSMGFTNPKHKHYNEMLAETPFLLINVPIRYWDDKENRTKAVRFLFEHSETPITDLGADDFKSYGLQTLLKYDSIYNLLTEAGYDIDIFDMSRMPCDGWSDKKNSIMAITKLCEKSGKSPSELTRKDFEERGLRGLVSRYNNTVALLLKELGFTDSEA